MNVTICGPNLNDQSKGTFHVHATGCVHLTIGARREPEYRNGWTFDADTRVSVAGHVYEDQIAESDEVAEDYVPDFHFFDCCAGLPHAENYIDRELSNAAAQPAANAQGAREWDAECRIAEAESGDLRAALNGIARATARAHGPADLAAVVYEQLATLGIVIH